MKGAASACFSFEARCDFPTLTAAVFWRVGDGIVGISRKSVPSPVSSPAWGEEERD